MQLVPRPAPRHRAFAVWLRILLLLGCVLVARGAAADERMPPDLAIELGRRGLSAYSRGEFAQALRDFSAAEELAHSPVFLLFMARCHRALNELVQARALFQRVAAEQLERSAPTPWHHAVASAHAELGSIVTQIPSVWVPREAASDARELWLDGERIHVPSIGTELELNPGAYTFEIRSRAGTVERLELTLEPGQRRVPLRLPPRARAQARATAPAPRLSRLDPLPPPTSNAQLQRSFGYGAIAAGAASLAVGITSGTIAWQITAGVKSRCTPEGVCRREDAHRGEQASDWAALSTVSFIAAAGLFTIGTVCVVVSPPVSTGASLAVSGAF